MTTAAAATPCLCTGRADARCDATHCDLAGEGRPGDPNQCRLCWLRLGKRSAPDRSSPCVHFGDATGETVECPSCAGKVRLKTFGCGLHGTCTPGKAAPGVACCKSCPDYRTAAATRPAPATWSMLLTAGIGDAFALEAMLAPEERETLSEIAYACPAAQEIETLFRSLASAGVYPRLKTHRVLPTGLTVHYSAEAVAGQVGAGQLPAGVRDFSIARVFPERRPYLGSSFLAHRLADADRWRPVIGRPAYAVVVPHSTWGRWPGRDFTADDWGRCLAALERHDLSGVVLCRERLGIPHHHRLIDLQGRTTILESVELLKAAQGYLGVDTALSVLAAKHFPASRLAVKSVWGHCYQWQETYFAPRKGFDFLTRELREPTWN